MPFLTKPYSFVASPKCFQTLKISDDLAVSAIEHKTTQKVVIQPMK